MALDSRFFYMVACPCGTRLQVSGESAAGARKCTKCGKYVRFAFVSDPKTGQKTVVCRGTTTQAPAAPLRRDPTPRASTAQAQSEDTIKRYSRVQGIREAGMTVIRCTCTAELRVGRYNVGRWHTCKWCGAANLLEKRETAPQRRGPPARITVQGRIEQGVCKIECACETALKFELAHANKTHTCPKCKALIRISLPATDVRPSDGLAITWPTPVTQTLTLQGGVYAIVCPCGSSTRVDPGSLHLACVCLNCHVRLKVTVKVDPKTKKKTALVTPLRS